MPVYLSDNVFPKLILDEQASDPATPATGQWRVYTKADGLYLIDDTGAVLGPLGAGVETGTAFPLSPTTGDRYRRSDLDYEVYFYDGTHWLTETLYSVALPYVGASYTSAPPSTYGALDGSGVGVYLERWTLAGYVSVSGAQWTGTLALRYYDDGTTPVIVADLTRTGGAAAGWLHHSEDIDTYYALGAGNNTALATLSVTEDSGAANAVIVATVFYRKVAT